MRKDRIGLQLYSLREEMKEDFYGTLKIVKDLGYSGVEFAGLLGHSPEEVKEMCKELGLEIVSAHVPVREMVADMDAVVDCYSRLGCKRIVIPSGPVGYRYGQEKYGEFVEMVKTFAVKLREKDMILQYHNHDFEFEKEDGKYFLDIMYEDMGPEYLQTQLDVCWVYVGGENPADYIRKYAGRIPTVHLKDFEGEKSENMYGLIGVSSGELDKVSDKFEFKPLGMGMQDLPAIIEAAEENGAEWLIVEQDRPTKGYTPLECATLSVKYLLSL